MAIDKNTVPNIDDSDPADYPNGQIRDNDGSDNGTPVNRAVFSDMFETFAKLMRRAGISYNGGFDNESSGYQYLEALIALANKNDFIQTLGFTTATISGVVTNILTITARLETLQIDEFFICKAIATYNAQTYIAGSTPNFYKAISSSDVYRANDYVLVINSISGVQIYEIATGASIDAMVSNLNYLKAASQAQENAGAVNIAATTPLTNRNAFIQRVVGSDSGSFLATTTTNGLLSAADKVKIDTFQDPTKNRGWFSGVDPGNMVIGSNLPHSGDVVSAIVSGNTPDPANDCVITVTFDNAMSGVDYFVRIAVESLGDIFLDNDLRAPVFKPINSTSFSFGISGAVNSTQSLKIHIEVVQIS